MWYRRPRVLERVCITWGGKVRAARVLGGKSPGGGGSGGGGVKIQEARSSSL